VRISIRLGTAAVAIPIVLIPASVAGERLPVRTLTTADGLRRDQLACVVSGERGFVWFCTGEGLVRWDGHLAHTFGRDDGLSPSGVRTFLKTGVDEVRGLALDTAGRLWAGTRAGLALIDRAAIDANRGRVVQRVFSADDGLPATNAYKFHVTRDAAERARGRECHEPTGAGGA
jgi:ligand-binding sensor domain-containing protein